MNNITICGNMTRDPEMKYTQNGKPMVTFGVADNRGRDKTIFFDCTAFDAIGERIHQYFKKGKPIFLSGPLDVRTYMGRDGQEKTALSVTVTSWDFVNIGRGENDNGGNGGNGGGESRGGYAPQQQQQRRPAPAMAPEPAPDFGDVPDISDPFADQ